MKENKVLELSKDLALDVLNLCDTIKETKKDLVLVNQLIRSGTSVGANIHESEYAQSKADFVSKLRIALKECYESEYWLELLFKRGNMEQIAYTKLFK